ncbi:Mini-ribonuclease 3 [Synechococcus sp. PCC 6312]|uniref:Mini-ribonuclease 3 n=1 Tax=Synechococcus sp. (strain ATCC 27167 / PCC 6312) TaxID=195253 RepID=UPI0012EA6C33|nr:ribonuclease III domain-containing protein [Synechococcus sp. PCC 6312]
MAASGYPLLIPGPGRQSAPHQYPPAAWAYLGDSIYELFIRSLCLNPPRRMGDYHRRVVEHVKAESQAKYLHNILMHLTPQELEIIRQGRNAATAGPKRVSAQIYQQATSLEALLGYLYISQPNRLTEILTLLQAEILLTDPATPAP